MLRFNTFRSRRYLRSKFVEGKFLLASEATDLELEILDRLRESVQNQMGDVAIADAWQVERLSSTQILIKPGEAWFKGLPFSMRSGKDQLVTGAILTIGTVPVGVTAADDSTGLGKVITFNNAAATPTNLYKVIITAKEQLVTEVEDPFLQNANITESTAQKVRLVYQLNIVPDSLQSESSLPYRDETGTSVSVTNFPSSGNFASPNFVNQVMVTPTAAGNGELVALNLITGSEGIDGRDLELTVRNNPALGGGNPLPNSPALQQAFYNGKLIDSNGSVFHVNAIFNDTVSTQVVLRIDKEPTQPNPEIVNTKPFYLVKRDVYVTDDVNGSPQGKLHWPIAKIDFHQTNGIAHDSKITDLRVSILDAEEFQDNTNQKIDLIPAGGGDVSFNVTGLDLVTWSSDISIMNAFGAANILSAGTQSIIENGALVYELDLANGGIVSKGSLAITVMSSGTTVTASGGDNLSSVRKGNILRLGTQSVQILSVNNATKQMTVTPSLSGTGSATIYLDSFAGASAPLNHKSYVLAVRKNNKVYVGGGSLELEEGETNQLGDGVPQGLLTFIGSTDENDANPNYSSTDVVTQGTSLVQAISDLDSALSGVLNALSEPIYDERILYPSGLPSGTNIIIPSNSRNGNVQQFYDSTNGLLVIYVNQLIKFQGVDWNPIDNKTISFNFDLPNDTEVHFRSVGIGGGSVGGGGGSGDLQDAYNIGRQITTTSGNPVEISGPGGKLLKVNGDMDVSGVIDPAGIEFTPQSSDPLGSGSSGLWVNNSNELMHNNGTFTKNLTQSIDNLESGSGVSALTRSMLNSTGSTITKGTPVYTPAAGMIAPANGSFNNASRVIGVANEDIGPAASGMVAFYGTISGVSGYTHGTYIYLGNDPGELVDVEPTLGPYSSGFNVIIIGIMEGTNLILQIQNVGRL